MTQERPNVEEHLAPLKGFQRKTVDYVFRRMYLDPDPAVRFLVADEVGLGKTLIARGIVARAIDHLWDTTRRIDVVYICSSVAIAHQNLRKLAIEAKHHPLATRLTLLPEQLKGLDEQKVNFVSFTPATSFDLKRRGGMAHERVILYWLLREAGETASGLRNLLQGGIRNRDAWRSRLDPAYKPKLDRTLRDAFVRRYRSAECEALRDRLSAACELFGRYREDWPWGHREERNALVGRLRMMLARTCVDALEPDLIILDEFQRFRELLRGDDETAQLARSLWSYITPEKQRARVLLLSATPYRMYSTDGEVGETDHYPDFIATTRFLMDDDEARVAAFEEKMKAYRGGIHAALHGDSSKVESARDEVERELRSIMVRTERVAATEDRAAMMDEVRRDSPLAPSDLRQWMLADELSRAVGAYDAVELWKSAPYLPQFMRGYQLKRKLVERIDDSHIAAILQRHADTLLTRSTVQRYKAIDPSNARLRALARDLLDDGQWQLLWVPPTLHYWPLAGAFAEHADFTKALVFSAWNVVPDVVSAVLSYEAERRALGRENDLRYRELHEKNRGLLRFSSSEGRLTGMPVLALQYPALRLADELCPLRMRADGVTAVREETRRRVAALVAELPAGEGRPDDRWHWAAPALLDDREAALAFLSQWTLEQPRTDDDETLDSSGAQGDDSRFADHVEMLRAVVQGKEKLGARPHDLADVLTDLALGAPGVLAMRALRPLGATTLARQRAAALVAEGFRTLFNQPIAMAIVKRLHPDVPYWQATLRYAIDGGLQAVLDEHFHQQWLQIAWRRPDPDDAARRVAQAMGYAASIKTSRIDADTLRVRAGRVHVSKLRLRTSYALRYGRVTNDEGAAVAREGAVRAAFNSPYRPFVLTSTSIGQEGLDFHPWCHAIVHWNLPGNPVDLEQREGRVHRYEGHAVRRNVAARFVARAFATWRPGDDIWDVLFEHAAAAREPGTSDLVPWWVCPGEHRVQRRIPTLPYSKEVEWLTRLKRDLVAYRLAFGQPRQQELLELVHHAEISVDRMDSWTLDLRPEGAHSQPRGLGARASSGTSAQTGG